MKVLELAYENKCNVFRTSDSNLYYTILNENSATSGYKLEDYNLEEICFRKVLQINLKLFEIGT